MRNGWKYKELEVPVTLLLFSVTQEQKEIENVHSIDARQVTVEPSAALIHWKAGIGMATLGSGGVASCSAFPDAYNDNK
jgi:hypothetical protein